MVSAILETTKDGFKGQSGCLPPGELSSMEGPHAGCRKREFSRFLYSFLMNQHDFFAGRAFILDNSLNAK
jgi:hypothetical protein